MPINKELLENLACPKCKGDVRLTEKEDGLICDNCKRIESMDITGSRICLR